jgi:hypothetical protein
MPNWCNNTVTLTHNDSSMIERAKKALQEGTFLNEFIPVPPEMFEGEAWYGFRISNWGTKWDVGLDQGEIFRDKEHELGFTFCSAWSPPIAAYEKLSDLGFAIEATYYEPGMMFCGYWANDEEDYWDIKGDSEWVRDHIPRIVDDTEGISVGMADWEHEERIERIEELKDLVEEEKDLAKRQELLNELDALLEKQEEIENA